MARLVLLHAFPLDSSLWRGVAARLESAGHDVLAPDLRGFGTSGERVEGAASSGLDRMADDVIAAIADWPSTVAKRGGSADATATIVAGCSMGGYVALAIARRRPDVVTALALVDSKATADDEAARSRREEVAVRAESGQDWSAGLITGLLGPTSRRSRPEVVAEVEAAIARARPESVAWAQRAMAARPDSREMLAGLSVPVLALMGEEDTISPREEQDLIVAAAPSARLAVIPGAGHLAPLECPEEVAAELDAFATP